MFTLDTLPYIPLGIILGQSNASGRALKTDINDLFLEEASYSYVWNGSEIEKFHPQYDGVAGNHYFPLYGDLAAVPTDDHGIETVMIKAWENYYDSPIVIFKYSIGGTSMLEFVSPTEAVWDTDAPASHMTSAERELRRLVRYLIDTYDKPIKAEFLVWGQGEDDAGYLFPDHIGEYKAANLRVINKVKEITANPNLPVLFLAPTSYDYPRNEWPEGPPGTENLVRYEQIEIALETQNAGVITCDQNDFYGVGKENFTLDTAHYNTEVFLNDGFRAIHMLRKMKEGDTAPQPVTNLIATPAAGEVALSWTASGSREYIIEIDGGSLTNMVRGTTTGTNYTAKDLEDGSYTATIYSHNDAWNTTFASVPFSIGVPSSTEEKDDLQAAYPATWQTFLDNRYSDTATINPVAFATWAALFPSDGSEARDPNFGTRIKRVSNINQINMERPHQNCDNSMWFLRTGTNFQFLSNAGTLVGSTVNLDFEGVNPTDAVRWHPTNPYIVFYIKDDHIIYYDRRDQSKTIAATSPNGTLGTGNRRLAGGDGNIAAKVGTEAWMLLTHNGKNTDAQVLVLGDPDNPQTNDWKIVSDNWNGSAWELQYETWTAGATKWDFPTGGGFDYATLTLKSPTHNRSFIKTVIDGQGTDLYNLSGTKIGDVDSNANHMNQVKATVGSTEYLATVKKTVGGMIPPAANIGDAHCWYYSVDLSANPMVLTVNGFVALDWGSGYNQAGGGQYSSYTSRKTCLIAMNSAVEEGAPDWQKYYSEIVELQLNRDAGDNVPRRLLHHMIDTFGSASEQPESWVSNDGTHGYFKTDCGGQFSGDGKLFWFEILERTPVIDR